MSDDLIEETDNFYVSWSDLVTLLLVFFVYLYSISEIDVTKFLEAQESMNSSLDLKMDMEKLELIMLEKQKLKQMMVSMQAFIEKEDLEDVFNVTYENDKLEINMGNQLLFELGEASLRSQAKMVLARVAQMFMQSQSQIIVEGHTDDLPIHTEMYPSNWELSTARAASVVRFLAGNDVEEGRFIVIGYNMYSPLVPNDSSESRAKNRRVKITLKPDMEQILAEYEKAKHGKS
jgi:chemotaxis protein MotB